MTKSELKKHLKELAGRRKSYATPFANDSDKASFTRKDESGRDAFRFTSIYLPHYFSDTTPHFHKEWNHLAEVKNRVVLIAAPRGHAKSAFFALLKVIHWVVYGKRNFIIVGSDTETQARTLVEFVKAELKDNERIKRDFGEMENPGSWAEGDLTTRNGVRIVARGKGQSMRGLRNGHHRPDAFIGDDLENDAEQQNPRRVEKTIDWVKRVVIPSFDPKGWSCVIVGTLISKRSALAILADEKHPDTGLSLYMCKTYRALDGNGEPLWPERFTKAYLEEMKTQIGSRAFNAEYMNDPKDDEGVIKEEWLTQWPTNAHNEQSVTAISIYTDPSVGETSRHDYKATIALAKVGDYYDVLCARIRKESVTAMITGVFDLYEDLCRLYPKARMIVGFEANGFQSVLKGAYEVEEGNRGCRLPLTLVTNSVSKMMRIESLSSPVERGLIRFNIDKPDQSVLAEQLIYLESPSVHDDGPDALEGANRLLSKMMKSTRNGYESLGKRRSGLNTGTGSRRRLTGFA